MIERFELNPDQLRIREILTDKSFLEVEIYAISDANPNRNGSHFTLESMEKGIKTFTDKPILGFFNRQNDFESHNGKVAHDPELDKDYWDNSNGEQILGFVRQSDHKEIVEGPDGLMWIRCTAMICTQYNYKQVKRLLKDKRKKVSVEVEYKSSQLNEDGIVDIYDFELVGITILGSKNGVQVQEGIEGAHLSVLDLMGSDVFSHQKQALVFAYAQLDPGENKKNKEDTDLAKDNFEESYTLHANKSKDAMSDKDWGSVDKTELRNKVVGASNFKEVAKDVFLDLREGWEDGETTKLKYPVMELKEGNELVYNRGGLASAKSYAQKNGEDEVLGKLRRIYKDLGLEFEEDYAKYSFDCGEDEELLYGKREACACGGSEGNGEGEGSTEPQQNEDGKQCHAEEGDGEGKTKGDDGDPKDEGEPKDGEPKEGNEPGEEPKGKDDGTHKEACDDQTEVYTIEQLTEINNNLRAECDDFKAKYGEYEEKCSQLTEKCEKIEKECDELNCKYSDLKKEYDKYKEEYEKMAAKVEEYALKVADYDEVKAALEKANEKFVTIKINEQISYVNQMKSKFSLMSSDIEDVMNKCKNGEYADNTSIDKDFAYVVFQKQKGSAEPAKFNVDIVRDDISNLDSRNKQDVLTRLQNNIKKN